MVWTRTDDAQWCKDQGDGTFRMIEIRAMAPDMYCTVHGVVDPGQYSRKDIEDILGAFGYEGVDDVMEQYGADGDQIIAECIFESTDASELDRTECYPEGHVDRVMEIMQMISEEE